MPSGTSKLVVDCSETVVWIDCSDATGKDPGASSAFWKMWVRAVSLVVPGTTAFSPNETPLFAKDWHEGSERVAGCVSTPARMTAVKRTCMRDAERGRGRFEIAVRCPRRTHLEHSYVQREEKKRELHFQGRRGACRDGNTIARRRPAEKTTSGAFGIRRRTYNHHVGGSTVVRSEFSGAL